MTDKILSLTAYEISNLVRCREVSALEICKIYLERAESETLGAYITVMRETAERAAAEIDAKILRGESCGMPLAGVPISIKDNICTAGTKTTCASRMLCDFVPSYSATVYEKLLLAGAVPIGKTNMDEFAVGSDGSTSYFGACRNPYDSERTPGGSSSGAAASVAGKLALTALGSDTGGSARVPASFCGIVAMKPTYGAVSRYGLVGMAPSLEQICPMTRNVRDNKLLFDVISGADVRDMTSHEHLVKRQRTGEKSRENIRVGVFLPEDTMPYTANAVLRAAEILRESGAEIKSVTLPMKDTAVGVYYVISSAEASSNLARFDGVRYGFSANGGIAESRTEGFGANLRERLAEGVYVLTRGGGELYRRATSLRHELETQITDIMAEYNVILMPTTDTDATVPKENMYAGDRYSVYANLTGSPAISVPAGVSDRFLPIGIQLMAGHGREDLLYAVAEVIEGGVQHELQGI